ncbi:hypothetical protein Acor_60690 [Acrocarpospora corrugata]|uniref:MalT-like TPR region domain-containing protein n=1 Tax=Acrocarpospora corrugata TaxID=35763 RepID=A0A5M3W9Z6_9ACTN|nr:tetratricopeptide repeat protein [Acrocarpospora corrugata]GES04003.1 hypothetical protein Acor_60690 [Acrocarpospora corrugata]
MIEFDDTADLGVLHTRRGRLDLALAHHAGSAAIAGGLGDHRLRAIALGGVGEVLHLQGRPAEAVERLTEALSLLDGDAESIAPLNTLALAYRDLGHLDDALRTARAAVGRAAGAATLTTLATILLRLGDPGTALAHATDAQRLATAAHERIEASLTLTAIHTSLAQYDRAHPHARQALTLSEPGYRLLHGNAMTALATLHHCAGRPAEAHLHATRALQIHQETGHLPGEAQTHLILAHTAPGEFRAFHLRAAFTLFAQLGANFRA